jgi:hypothetical protein
MSMTQVAPRDKEMVKPGDLYMGFELGDKQWKLSIGDGHVAMAYPKGRIHIVWDNSTREWRPATGTPRTLQPRAIARTGRMATSAFGTRSWGVGERSGYVEAHPPVNRSCTPVAGRMRSTAATLRPDAIACR